MFAMAVILHNGDHLRRGVDKLSSDVFWVGTAGIILEVTLVVLMFQRHRLAPLAALLGGALLAVGYVEVHFLPAHGWLSDSLVSPRDISALSWAAASLEVSAAFILAAVGLWVFRRRGGLESAFEPRAAERPLAEAVRHPVSLIMIVTQGATLAVSFAQAYG
jgi:hypothetical protein